MREIEDIVEDKLDLLSEEDIFEKAMMGALIIESHKVFVKCEPSDIFANFFGVGKKHSYRIACIVKDYFLGSLSYESKLAKSYISHLKEITKMCEEGYANYFCH